MTGLVHISQALIASTVAELSAARATERVVLWLGQRLATHIAVSEVFAPIQEARADFFHIPRRGMEDLLEILRVRRLMVAAQVHTHPDEAFHSQADDRWAIVRHAGALSLVVPRFCQETTPDTFTKDALVYRLDENNDFALVDSSGTYRVTP